MSLPGLHAAILIPWTAFNRAQIHELLGPLEELRIALKVATRFTYDNSYSRIDFSGKEFAFSLKTETAQLGSERDKELRKRFPKYGGGPNGSNARTLTIWNRGGNRQVFEAVFIAAYDEPLPKEVERAAASAMSNYAAGAVACSDCGTPTEASTTRTYFAGTYCSGCWEGTQGQHAGRGGWRAVEARETYE